jgi:hypothetical protein
MMEYLPFAAYTIGNGGVYKHQSENSASVDKTEVDFLIEKERKIAEFYVRRFVDYMTYNQSLFPEYYANVNDDMYPDQDVQYSGWVL